MAADLKFRDLTSDAEVSNPLALYPFTMYRGMASYQEYHDVYVKNEGTTLYLPSYTLRQEDTGIYNLNFVNAKITGSTKDGGSTSTVYVDWQADNGGMGVPWNSDSPDLIGPVAIPDGSDEMAANRCYDIWFRVIVQDTNTTLGTYGWSHVFGGDE